MFTHRTVSLGLGIALATGWFTPGQANAAKAPTAIRPGDLVAIEGFLRADGSTLATRIGIAGHSWGWQAGTPNLPARWRSAT
jgi:hypothetical protein